MLPINTFNVFDEFDRLAARMFSALTGLRGDHPAPVNLSRKGDRYELEAELPGVDPGAIDVSVDGPWLTIRADRSDSREHQDAQWLVRERRDASVLRRVAVGQDIDVDAIEANYRDGVLKVILPITEEAKPRKIAVTSGPVDQRAIDGADPAPSDAGKAEPAQPAAA